MYKNPYAITEETRRNNSRVSLLLSSYLNLIPDAITPDMVLDFASNCGVSLSHAYAECLAAACGLDVGGADREIFKNYFLPMVHQLQVSDFESDPYYKTVGIPDTSIGRWQLQTQKIKPCEAFICGDFDVESDGRLLPRVGFFMDEFSYPAVLESGREWMTLMPNETVTTMPAVNAAYGRVLTFGLGLGYFSFMASQKTSVSEVSVVDFSEDVIELFSRYILPQFPNKHKIRLIKADAFSFAESLKDGEYDFVFADIWHDAGDGREPYLRMKDISAPFAKTRFMFWLEDSIKCYLDKTLWPRM